MWFLLNKSFNGHCCTSHLRPDFQYFDHLLPVVGDAPEELMKHGDQIL